MKNFIKNLKGEIKLNKDAFKAAYKRAKECNEDIAFISEFKNDDYTLIQDDERCNAECTFLAQIRFYNFQDKARAKIYVDKYFMQLPTECKDAVIFHELGHFDDNLRTGKFNTIGYRATMDDELYADRYAIERAGKENLIRTFELLYEMRPSFSMKKLTNKRIEMIKSL